MTMPLNSHFKKKSSTRLPLLKTPFIVGLMTGTLLIMGCGGDNTNDSVEQTNPVLGVWFGQATTIEGEQENVVIAVSPEGKAVMFSHASHNMLIAHGVVSESIFSSEDTMYYPGDNMTRYGSMQASAVGDSLDGSASVSGRILGFSATKMSSQNSVTLTDIAGNYSKTWENVSYTRSFSIDSDGVISGSDTEGCVYSGAVEPISGMNTLFNVTINAEVCANSFEYDGLLTYGVFPFSYEGSTNERKGIVIVTEHSSRAYAFRLFSPQN